MSVYLMADLMVASLAGLLEMKVVELSVELRASLKAAWTAVLMAEEMVALKAAMKVEQLAVLSDV